MTPEELIDWVIDITGSICECVGNCGNCRFWDSLNSTQDKRICTLYDIIQEKLKE